MAHMKVTAFSDEFNSPVSSVSKNLRILKSKSASDEPNKIKWRVINSEGTQLIKPRRSIDVYKTLDIINQHLMSSNEKLKNRSCFMNYDTPCRKKVKVADSAVAAEEEVKFLTAVVDDTPDLYDTFQYEPRTPRTLIEQSFIVSDESENLTYSTWIDFSNNKNGKSHTNITNAYCDSDHNFLSTCSQSDERSSCDMNYSQKSMWDEQDFLSPSENNRSCPSDLKIRSLVNNCKICDSSTAVSFNSAYKTFKDLSLEESNDIRKSSLDKQNSRSTGIDRSLRYSSADNTIDSENRTFMDFSYNLLPPDEKKRKIFHRIKKTRIFSSFVDIDEVQKAVDIRVVGKHDKWLYSGKRKLVILGDSHTRFLVFGLQHIFPGLTIEAFCKPSAKCEQVISGMEDTIESLNRKDFLILLCGTNDMWGGSGPVDDACQFIHRSLKKMKNTNILLCDVPRNYSESEESHVQDNIRDFNRFLHKSSKEFSNVFLVRLHKLKEKHYFTKHGLHFNATGKIKICELISHRIIDFLDKINYQAKLSFKF